MKKKVLMLSLVCVFCFSTKVCAAPKEMCISHPEEGVTEGDVEEDCIVVNGNVVSVNNVISTYATYYDFVGIGIDDRGPWEHGVTSLGILYSRYTNPKYWHGSSVLGSNGTTRSEWVQPNAQSSAEAKTVWTDGNHAYWRVDENRP